MSPASRSSRSAARPAWIAWALVAAWLPCVAVVAGHGDKVNGDGMGYYVYARALAVHGDLTLHAADATPTEKNSTYLQDWYLGEMRKHGGAVFSQYPAGLAFAWLPGVAAVHGILTALHAADVARGVPADGFAKPYRLATAITTLLMALVGLWLTWDLAARIAGPGLGLLATVGGLYATGLFNYLSYETSMSEGPSWFAVTLALWLWLRVRRGAGPGAWFAWGAVLAFGSLIRYQQAVLFALPLWEARRSWRRYPWLALGALPWFAAQGWVWSATGGPAPYATGIDSLAKFRPDLVLWSARHGLIASHPLWLFGLIGFAVLVWRGGAWERGVAMLFLFMLWLNQLPYDFWAGHSFGARRFVPLTLVCSLGVAWWLRAMTVRWRRIGAGAAVAGIAALALLSLAYLRDYREHGDLRDLPFPQAKYLGASFQPVYRLVGWPFSWPANLAWALRWGTTPDRYDTDPNRFADNAADFGRPPGASAAYDARARVGSMPAPFAWVNFCRAPSYRTVTLTVSVSPAPRADEVVTVNGVLAWQGRPVARHGTWSCRWPFDAAPFGYGTNRVAIAGGVSGADRHVVTIDRVEFE